MRRQWYNAGVKRLNTTLLAGIAVLAFTVFGAWLRLGAVSPYKFYPDSYQNLLVARNIREYKSVIGTLGSNGMVFPPFFLWTRPVYPLLINVVLYGIHDETVAAQTIALTLGILAIPLSYLAMSKLWKSNAAGLAAAALIAISFNHAVWSGYIMTETIGVFMALLFLLALASGIDKSSDFASPGDYATGALLAVMALTRYEYILIALSALVLIIQQNPKPAIKIINISASFVLILAILVSRLFPLRESIDVVIKQMSVFLRYAGIVAGLSLGCIVTLRFAPKNFIMYITTWARRRLSLALLLMIALVVLDLFGVPIPFVRDKFPGYMQFFRDDALLVLASLWGLAIMLKAQQFRPFAWFTVIAVALLAPVYYRINPAMERYGTHLIPFLLIAASFGLADTIKRTRTFGITGAIVIVGGIALTGFQLATTVRGFRDWGDGAYVRASYEEKATKEVANRLQAKDTLLIVSFPEPYFYFTGASTQSVANSPPYIYIDNVPDERQVLIVDDMGMRDLFPRFSAFLRDSMQEAKRDEFFVGERYQYAFHAASEDTPVILYQTTLGRLNNKISSLQY